MQHYEILQRLCVTPRWAGMQTSRTESVMEHKALVMMYTHLLTHETKNYEEYMGLAIAHDCEEAITGDLKYSFKNEKVIEFAEKAVYALLNYLPPYECELLRNSLDKNYVILCADRISSAHFWINEKNMGNINFADGNQMYKSIEEVISLMKECKFENIIIERAEKTLLTFTKLKI